MDKNIIKNIIIEKQENIPGYQLTRRNIPFGSKTNYVLVGLRRAGKEFCQSSRHTLK